MSTDFVVHPDGTVDAPLTGSYTMGPEEFANADTQRAWSVPPQPHLYYDEPPYQELPQQDWAGVVKLVGGIVAAGVVIIGVVVLAISLSKPTPTTTVSATQTVTATPIPTQTVTATPNIPTQTVTALLPPTIVVPPPVTMSPPPARPSTAPVPTLLTGDLGLPTPMSRPSCNGQGIVVLGNVTTPGMYAAGVQNLLSSHPGASYLRADQVCPSLRRESDEGTPIYAVFKFAGTTQREVCTAVRAAGVAAYGKWLDYSTDPAYIIPC
jgi:serine/threonine-protein kinase